MTRRTEIIAIIVLVLIAAAMRFYHLADLMPFTYDQGRDMYTLLKMSRGDFVAVGPTTGLSGVFLGPFYFYFLLPGFLLSGGSPFGVAYWVLFWTTICLPLFYLLLKPVIGKRWALLGLALLVITTGSIDEARIIWNPSFAVPLLLSSFWLLFTSVKKPWLLVPSLFMFGLSLQTELAYTMFLFPAYVWWVWKHRSEYNWKHIVLSLAVLGVTLLPQAAFELKNNFLMTRSILAPKEPGYTVSLKHVWETRPSQIAYTIQHRTLGTTHVSMFGFVLVLLAVLYVATKKPKPQEAFWVLVFTLPLVGLMFHTGNYGYFFPYYLNPHYLPALALLLIALKKIRWGTVGLVGLALFMAWSFYKVGQVIYNPEVLQYTIRHQINALMAIREQKQIENPGLSVYTPNLVPINYQYLNEWLAFSGKAEAVEFGTKDRSEYFLLYEDDPYADESFTFKPWYEQWSTGGECGNKTQFGIVWLEKCIKTN